MRYGIVACLVMAVGVGVVPAVLAKAGVDAAAVADVVREGLEKQPKVEGGAEPYLSRRLRKVIDEAEAAARDQKDEYVSTEHLLLGVLAEGSGPSFEALKRAGATKDAVLGALKTVRGAHRVTDPNPEGKFAALEKYTLDLTERARQALDDRRLADAGLADEHGVVLGAAAEDLHDPLHLCLLYTSPSPRD